MPPDEEALRKFYAEKLLSGEELVAIEAKVKSRAKSLVSEKHREIEESMNEVIFN